jgi:hypothetical protein
MGEAINGDLSVRAVVVAARNRRHFFVIEGQFADEGGAY